MRDDALAMYWRPPVWPELISLQNGFFWTWERFKAQYGLPLWPHRVDWRFLLKGGLANYNPHAESIRDRSDRKGIHSR